jgi:hypothetical protein
MMFFWVLARVHYSVDASVSKKHTVSISTFLQTFIYFNSLNYFLQARKRHIELPSRSAKWQSFLFNSPYSILYGIISPLWLGLPHVFGHFPIGYRFSTFSHDVPIHPKKIDPFHPAWQVVYFIYHVGSTVYWDYFNSNNVGCLKHDGYNDSKKL